LKCSIDTDAGINHNLKTTNVGRHPDKDVYARKLGLRT